MISDRVALFLTVDFVADGSQPDGCAVTHCLQEILYAAGFFTRPTVDQIRSRSSQIYTTGVV